MLRPSGISRAHRPFGATATPGGTSSVTTARKRHQPRALSTITGSPALIARAAASTGLISTNGAPSFAIRPGWLAKLLEVKWCDAPEIKIRGWEMGDGGWESGP